MSFNGMKLILPKGWHQVSIRQFCAIYEAENFVRNAIEKELYVLSALTTKPISELEKIPVPEFRRIMGSLAWMKELPQSAQIPTDIEVDGKPYHVQLTAKDMTAGQLVDMLTLRKDGDDAMRHLHMMMAIIARPKDEKTYDGKAMIERADLFYDKLNIAIVYPIAVFFCTLWASLSTHILASLGGEAKRLNEWMASMASTATGDGQSPLTSSQT